MSSSPPPAWFWARLLEPPHPQPDPADVGTAFGLDLSVRPVAADAPGDVDRTQPGWLQRLGLI